MEADPRLNDLRKETRRRRFGPDAACMLCGESDPVSFHHMAGRNNDEALEGPVCLNCHAKAHEGLRDAGVALGRGSHPTVPERIEAVLRALSTFFVLLGNVLWEWAERQAAFVRQLDEAVPDWRAWEVVKP
jgi:hypothetical protein